MFKRNEIGGKQFFSAGKKITSLDFSMYISTQLEEEKKDNLESTDRKIKMLHGQMRVQSAL